jgi:hypothetical protein
MEDLQPGCIIWNVLLGICILLSYYFFLIVRIGGFNKKQIITSNDQEFSALYKARLWLWAGFYDWIWFYVWCCSAILSTISYLILFAVVVCADHKPLDGFVWSNLVFLVCSSVYALLVFRVFQELKIDGAKVILSKIAVIVDLFIVMISAWCMVGFSASDEKKSDWAVPASVLLAVHCTFLDFGWWGYTWFNNKNESAVFHNCWMSAGSC